MEWRMKAVIVLAFCVCFPQIVNVVGTTPRVKHWRQLCQMTSCSELTSDQSMPEILIGSQTFHIEKNEKDCFKNCTQKGHCFFLPTNSDSCTKDYRIVPGEARKPTQLLILPYRSQKPNNYQLNLPSTRTVRSPISWKNIRSVLYLKTKSMFLIGRDRDISSTSRQSPLLRTVTRKYTEVESMTSDEEAGLVFLIAHNDLNTPCNIYKMTLEGRGHSYLIHSPSKIACLLQIDTKRKRFYLNSNDGLEEAVYQGYTEWLLKAKQSEHFHTFTFVQHLNATFFTQNSNLEKLSNGNRSFLLPLPSDRKSKGFLSMVYHADNLYISLIETVAYILRVNLSGNSVTKIELPEEEQYLLIII